MNGARVILVIGNIDLHICLLAPEWVQVQQYPA